MNKGIISSQEELLPALQNNDLFKDYLFEFCSQEVFTIQPSKTLSTEADSKFSLNIPAPIGHQKKWILNFLLQHRIPYFNYSIFFNEYRFFEKLFKESCYHYTRLPRINSERIIRSAPSLKVSRSIESPLLKRSSSFVTYVNNKDTDKIIAPVELYEKCITYLSENTIGRKLFLSFLKENGVSIFFTIWMKIERCKDIIVLSDDEQSIKEKKLYILRLVQDFFKSKTTGIIKGLFVSSIGDVSLELLTKLQDKIMKRIVSYWLPRYSLHFSNFFKQVRIFNMQLLHLNTTKEGCEAISLVDEIHIINKAEAKRSCLLALRCDRACGYPFTAWITSTYPHMVFGALFWVDMFEYLEDFYLLDDRTLKLISLWKIFHIYFDEESILANYHSIASIHKSIKNMDKLTKENIQAVFIPYMNKAVCLIEDYWEEYCENDCTNYERSEIRSVISPTLSSVLIRKRQLLTSSIPRTALLSSYSQKRGDDTKEKNNVLRKKRSKKKKVKKVVVKDTNNNDSDSDVDDEDDDDFMEHIGNTEKMSLFKDYMQIEEGRISLNDLLLFLEIEIYFSIGRGKQTQKQQTAMAIYKTFFDPASRKAANLPEGFVVSVNNERPSSPTLREAQQYVLPQLQDSYKNFYVSQKKYEKQLEDAILIESASDNSKKKSRTKDSQYIANATVNKGRNRRGSGRAPVSKKERTSFFSLLSSNCSKSKLQMNVFRRYLLKYEGSGFSRLDKDLLFCAEVIKFKELFTYLDEKSILKKIEVIIDVFLDSASPPWLQIDIPAELASKITQRFQQNFNMRRKTNVQPVCDNTIFDEAFNLVLKELLPFWSGYQQHLTSLHWNQMLNKMTKAEKKKLRLKKEFNDFQPITEPIQVKLSTNRDAVLEGDSPTKTVLNFSLKNGYEWKNVVCETNRRRRRGTLLTKSLPDV